MPARKATQAVEATPKKVSAKVILADALAEVSADIKVEAVRSSDEVDFEKLEEEFNLGKY